MLGGASAIDRSLPPTGRLLRPWASSNCSVHAASNFGPNTVLQLTSGAPGSPKSATPANSSSPIRTAARVTTPFTPQRTVTRVPSTAAISPSTPDFTTSGKPV